VLDGVHEGVESVGLRLAEARVEDGAEALERAAHQRGSGGCRRVDDGTQARKVRRFGIWMIEENAQQRRDHENHRHAVLGNGPEHGLRIGRREDHEGRPRDPTGVHRPAAEVAERELAQQAIVRAHPERGGPGAHRSRHARVAVRDALRVTGGAGGVEDLGEGTGRTVDGEWLGGFGFREQVEIGGPLAGGQRENRCVIPRRFLRARDRVGAEGNDEAGLGVAHHEGVLCPGEDTEQRHQRASGSRDGDHRLDVLDPVLLHHRHALSGLETQADQRTREPRRAIVELAIGATPLAVHQGDSIGPAPRSPRRVVRVGMDHLRPRRRSGGRCRSEGPA